MDEGAPGNGLGEDAEAPAEDASVLVKTHRFLASQLLAEARFRGRLGPSGSAGSAPESLAPGPVEPE